MKLHSDVLTLDDIRAAATHAGTKGWGRIFLSVTCKGSRSRKFGFDVSLTSDGTVTRRLTNSGGSGAGNDYAASWDAWGHFLGYLFDVDPAMDATYYKGAEDFVRQTTAAAAHRKSDAVFLPSGSGL